MRAAASAAAAGLVQARCACRVGSCSPSAVMACNRTLATSLACEPYLVASSDALFRYSLAVALYCGWRGGKSGDA